MTFPLPPIASAHDAADIMAAVAQAVATGHLTPGEAAEFAKVVDAYVKAYQTARVDHGVVDLERLTDAELMFIAAGGNASELPKRLALKPR